MSIIRGSWDARTEDFIGEKLEPPAMDHKRRGVLCRFCGDEMPLGRAGVTCSRACSRCLSSARAREIRCACELCGVACSQGRYLCSRCADDLGLRGTFKERSESLRDKRDVAEALRDRGVA